MKKLLVVVLWFLVSLAGIALLGESPYWGLALAVAGGAYIGWEEASHT